jgi:hypothetical protein
MIDQAYISKSLAGLEERFLTKYNLRYIYDVDRPLAIFGMYNPEDFQIFQHHGPEVVVIWQGCDAKEITEESAKILKSRLAKHYAISHWIHESLNSWGIENEVLPVSATSGSANPIKRGDCVYFYSSDLSQESADYYGEYMIGEIADKTGLKIIRATFTTHPPSEIQEIYKQCFINLRLTTYDGCPNTNLEMGLMGIPSVFNGNIPHSIKWSSVDDICEAIMKEYANRHTTNDQIAYDMEQFINQPNLIFL